MKDYTFIATDFMNQSLNQFPSWNRFLIIYSSLLIDILGLSHLWYYYWYQKSGKYLFALIFFYGMRGIVQNNFLMTRVKGYAWWDPEFLSIIVPYHDVLDFYYSGHIGFSTIHLL